MIFSSRFLFASLFASCPEAKEYFFERFDKVVDQAIGIPDLAVEKDSFGRGERGLKKKFYLLRMFHHSGFEPGDAVIYCITPQHIIFYNFCSPNSEIGPTFRFYSVTHRDNDIQIIKSNFSFDRSITFFLNCQGILDS